MPMRSDLREKLPWFPAIDKGLCRADLRCVNFCPNDVFEWDPKTGKPRVAHPKECILGCEICFEACDTAAISLPTKKQFKVTLDRLRRFRQKSPFSTKP
jgi:NAD-dependent dihydropyrimidine dehydrogenase PreA subunit